MGETDKPFACTNEGCQMSFTNEDHLNVHRKKHDMVLNLGLACKNNVTADQTPTPTRFIRNCEEVGLFQDLQNVNPFEETFKKAVEHSKTGILHVPDLSNDDSLHTPQIFHHISENNINKLQQTPVNHFQETIVIDDDLLKIDSRDSSSKDDCLSPMENSTDIKENHFSYSTEVSTSTEKDYELSSSNSNDTIVEELSIVKKNLNNYLLKSKKHDEHIKSNVKEKIKEALHNKRKSDLKPLDLKMKNTDLSITLVKETRPRISLKSKLKIITPEIDTYRADNQQNIDFYDKNLSEVEKRRTMNRMAQMRSRKRKKMWLDQMEQEIDKLKMDNKLIVMENQKLKEENMVLKSMLLKHDNCLLADSKTQNGQGPVEILNNEQVVSIQTQPVVLKAYAIQPLPNSVIINQSSNNVIINQNSNNVILSQSSNTHLLPKLLPKTDAVNKSKNSSTCKTMLADNDTEKRLNSIFSEKVLNLTSMKIPKTLYSPIKAVKREME